MTTAPRRRLTVVGAGYVGLVTAVGLARLGHQVEVVETRSDRLEALRAGRVPIHEAGLQSAFEAALGDGRLTVADHPGEWADAALVCVGTPIGADGRSDLSQLRSALQSLDRLLAGGVPLVVRSTLPPGATRTAVDWSGVPPARVLTNPEFLRQGTALDDFLHPTRIVIGHFPDAEPATIGLVAGLYEGIEAPVLVVDVAAAELIKNGANAFLALRLSYTNEIAALCEVYGTDVEAVLDGITRDPRIGSAYMRPSFGFGGSCLPKELQALTVAGRDRGLDMHVTTAAAQANLASQARFADRIAAAAGGLDGRAVALLGLAFKAGTDDVRDSPAIGVARRLMDGGARLRAYDPQAAANALRAIPDLDVRETVEETVDGALVVVIATEWPEFAALDWAALRERVGAPVIVDGRRLLDPGRMAGLGFRYERVGHGLQSDARATRPVAGE